jgi:hypothetical protein
VRGKVMLIVLLMACNVPAIARADGGTVRCSEVRDGCRITVFTAPTTLRAGPVDVSVLVQDAASGTPLLDVPILVSAHPANYPGLRISIQATSEAATNKFLRAAPMNLVEPGWWHVDVMVQDSKQSIGFDVEVAEAPPPWLALGLWIGWPLLAIAVFAVHQWLVRRRSTCRRP